LNRSDSRRKAIRFRLTAGLPPLIFLCAAACATAQPRAPHSVQTHGITWLVFADELHLNFRNTGHLRALLRATTAELLQKGDSIVLSSGEGPSPVATEVSADPGFIEQQIAKVTGAALRPREILNANLPEPSEVRYRMHIALSSVRRTMQRFAAEGRPMAIIYVSNGYVVAPSPADIAKPPVSNAFSTTGTRFSVEQVRSEMAVLIAEARRAQIRVFAIDPRGMPGAILDDTGVAQPAFEEYLAATRNSLRVLAERTGGFAILDGELSAGLARIITAMRE
jgi:hypothetical protein